MHGRSKYIILSILIGLLVMMILLLGSALGIIPAFSSGFSAAEASMRYPYQQLSSREKKLYIALYNGIAEYEEVIRLPGIYTRSEYERVYLMLLEQEPQFFYMDSVYETADAMADVNMFYDVPQEDIPLMTAQMDLVADRIIKQAESARTTMLKLLAIHDGIAAVCEYSDGKYQDEAYGCLVEGQAKCEGYAKAFLYVTRRAGLHVMDVTGTIKGGENHVWNIADIDGTYYHIDLTWDDDKQYKGKTAHNCFAVPDSMFGDHYPDLTAYVPPVCDAEEHGYYSMQQLVLSSAADLPRMIQTWVWDTSLMEFQYENEQVYAEIQKLIAETFQVRDAVKQVSGAAAYRAIADEPRGALVIMPS